MSFLLIMVLTMPGTAVADIAAANARARSGDFDAMGKVACAQEVGQALGPCGARVARTGNAAAVVVTFPNGFRRTLMFEDNAFLRGNATMSGVGTDMEWHLSDDLFRVRVDDQRFEIPAALVLGP
ncbi:MAG: hypothetical protein AAFY39_11780 [Pseudomonadota bacterium]